MRRGPAIVLACALSACAVKTDIVAYGPGQLLDEDDEDYGADAGVSPFEPMRLDGGKRRDGGVAPVEFPPEAGLPLDAASMPTAQADAGVPPDPLRCADAARHLILIDKGGVLSRVHADSLNVEQLGRADCLAAGVVAAAVDRDGALWVSTQDRALWWIAPGSTMCAPSNLKVSPGPLTFVYDRETNRELLYFVDANNTLAALEPEMFGHTSLGPIKTQFLVGTGSEGDLLSINNLGDTTLSLDFVSVDDAVSTPMWKIARKVDQTLMGAAGWQGEVVLLLKSDLYSYRRDTDTLSWLPIDPPLVGTYVALASSVCGASSK